MAHSAGQRGTPVCTAALRAAGFGTRKDKLASRPSANASAAVSKLATFIKILSHGFCTLAPLLSMLFRKTVYSLGNACVALLKSASNGAALDCNAINTPILGCVTSLHSGADRATGRLDCQARDAFMAKGVTTAGLDHAQALASPKQAITRTLIAMTMHCLAADVSPAWTRSFVVSNSCTTSALGPALDASG